MAASVSLELDPVFLKGLGYLHSKSKDSAEKLKALLDESLSGRTTDSSYRSLQKVGYLSAVDIVDELCSRDLGKCYLYSLIVQSLRRLRLFSQRQENQIRFSMCCKYTFCTKSCTKKRNLVPVNLILLSCIGNCLLSFVVSALSVDFVLVGGGGVQAVGF